LTEIKSEQQTNHLEKWFEFTQRLYSTLDLNQASRVALDVALQLTGMKRGMLLTNENKDGFRCRHAQNQEGRTLSEQQFHAASSLLREVCEKGTTVQRSQNSEEAKTALGIPLISELFSSNKVVGVLYCESPEDRTFGPAEEEMIRVFLQHASPALESIILFDWATRDSTTGVYLRHYFDAMSQIEWRRTLRHKHPCAVLKVDLDQLRDYNATYGRKDGDMVLIKTAEILTEICRTEDLIARYDVDEFAVLLAETDAPGAKMVAGRITEEVPLLLTRDPEKPVTVSIGGATFPRCAVSNITDLLKLADSALTWAKESGGKRAIFYDPGLISTHRKMF
jgi:diguanylate cyclase (GGDEF)-like protein